MSVKESIFPTWILILVCFLAGIIIGDAWGVIIITSLAVVMVTKWWIDTQVEYEELIDIEEEVIT